jgi:hypothetical protein
VLEKKEALDGNIYKYLHCVHGSVDCIDWLFDIHGCENKAPVDWWVA